MGTDHTPHDTDIIQPTDLDTKPDGAEGADQQADTKAAADPTTEHTVGIDHGHAKTWLAVTVLVALILGVSAYLLVDKHDTTPAPAATTTTTRPSNGDLANSVESEATGLENDLTQLSDSDFDDSGLSDSTLYN